MAFSITSRNVSVAARVRGMEKEFSHSSFMQSVLSSSSSMYIGEPQRIATATASDARASVLTLFSPVERCSEA